MLVEMKCSYSRLQLHIQKINFNATTNTATATTTKSPLYLPSELARHVANFLTVERVQKDQVEAVTASSHDKAHKLSDCLQDNETTWWISGFGSMPGGQGEEYVELRLCSQRPILRRLRAVCVRIPPLPMGPLSVREFRVDVSDGKGTWRQLPFQFSVDNRTGMQRFALGEVDAHSVRIVCLSNQISAYLESMESPHSMERVGFYAVQFE